MWVCVVCVWVYECVVGVWVCVVCVWVCVLWMCGCMSVCGCVCAGMHANGCWCERS